MILKVLVDNLEEEFYQKVNLSEGVLMKKKLRISPSIIAVDYNSQTELNEAIAIMKKAHISMMHLDVMDGKFVPTKTFDAEFVKKMRDETDFLLDVHLMVKDPEKVIDEYIEAGADILTVHYESTKDLEGVLRRIKANGLLAGVSLKIETEIDVLAPLIKNNLIDVVLIMSVEPGACGRPFDASVLSKIRSLRELNSKLEISVDGGINQTNIKEVVEAGANIAVAGSAIFGTENPLDAIRTMRGNKNR